MTKQPIALFIALAGITLVTLSGCDPTSSLTELEHIQRAKDSETRGDLKTSIIELKNAVQKNPDSAQARLLLGQLYLKTEQGAEAEKELQRAKSLGVGEASVKALLAEALLQQRNYQRLFKEIELTGTESAANKSKILRMYGDAKLGQQKLDEGCSLYAESSKLDASHIPAHWGLANCAYAKGNADEARNQIQAALKVDPNNPNSWILLGDLEQAEGKPDAAEAAYVTALKHDPASIPALFKHASLMLSKGKTDAAQQDLNNIRKAAPTNFMGDFLQAQLYFAADKTDAALESTLKSLKARPDNVPAYLLLGMLQYNKKSYSQAAKTLSQYVQIVPGNEAARKILAATYLKLGEPEQTLVLIKPLLLVKTSDPQAYALAAEAYMALKEPGTATSLFVKASDLVPADASLQTQLALSRMATGDTAQAITDLERASRSDTGAQQSGFVLTLHYLRNNQPDQALETLADLIKTSPNDPSLQNMKGVAYGSKNDFANARKSFEQALALAPDYFSAAHNLALLDLSQNKPEAARKRYEAILAKNNKNARAMVALGQMAALEGKETEYVSWLNKAIKVDPSAMQPKQLLAKYYVDKKQGGKALALAHEAMTANPDAPESLSLLGKTQFATGEKENALVSFTRLVQQNPNSADAHYHLGIAQRALNKPNEARASLKRAIEKQPGYLPAQETLIAMEIESGHSDEALRIAAAIQTQQPKSPLGSSLEGDIQLAAKNYSKAARAYERASTLNSSNILLVKWHQALALSEGEKAADSMIKPWLVKHPEDLFVQAYLARHYLSAGRHQEAISAHEKLLQKAPRDFKLMNNLAWLYQQTGDPRALRIAENAYKLAPGNPAIQDTLGWLLVQGNQAARGRDLLAKAAAASDSPSIRFHYAAALEKTGDKAKARLELVRTLKSTQPFSEKAQAEALLKSL